jgi:Mg-chelatase subunit ChlD
MSAAKSILSILVALVLVAPAAPAQSPVADPLIREREEQTGTAITILFDNSGSMKKDNKIGQAKAAFRSWLQTVPADYKMSLITFENTGRLNVPLGERTRDLIAQRVAKLDANTSTPICGALRIAREQIEKRRREVTPYERHVVLVFTDGQETADPRGTDGVRADIAALRAQTVEVVGVGFHGEGDYMNGVATRFALANNEQELKQSLAKVDAEVGGVDDLVVSPADLAALRGFHVVPVPAVSALAVATPDPAPPASTDTSSHGPVKKGIPFGWIVAAFVGWLLLRGFSNSKKTKR